MLHAIHHESKSTLLTGDFNINLVNYNKKEEHITFSSSLITILHQKLHSAILIDNTFVDDQSFKYISSNITTSISGHLPQFIILENFKENNLKREQIEI